MVLEPTLHHIDEAVIAIWIRGDEEKAGVHEEPQRVVHDSFHDFAVEKLNPDPDAVHDGRGRMEVERMMFAVAVEVVDVKNGFGIRRGDLLHRV